VSPLDRGVGPGARKGPYGGRDGGPLGPLWPNALAMTADTGAGTLESLFNPATVAVVGASATPGKAGHAMMAALSGFGGTVFAVNPGRPVLAGSPAFASVREIGRPVDLAVLVVPASAVPAALEDCGQAGVAAAVVCAGGFAESARVEGAALQDSTLTVVRRHGIRLLGPNTSGFMNPIARLCANFVPTAASLEPGRISVVAQSGGVNLATCFLCQAEGLGIRIGVGLGNAADVSFTDVLDWLAEDAMTGAVGLHIEGVADGEALAASVSRLTERVPVVALKVGKADVADFARSHTGAMLGSHRVAVTALRTAGAVVVDELSEMVDALHALSLRRAPANRSPGVAVVTAQAGPGLLIADGLRSTGVSVPPLNAGTVERISGLLPPLTWIANPVDTGRPSDTFGPVLDAVLDDPAIDVVALYALDEPEALDPAAVLRERVGRVPLVVGTGGPPDAVVAVRSALGRLGVPTFPAPDRVVTAVGAIVADSVGRARPRASTASTASTGRPPGAALVGDLDEDQAKALFDSVGIPTMPRRACSTRDEAHGGARVGAVGRARALDRASRTAFSFRMRGRTSSLMSSLAKSASQRSGVMTG
jgi:acyl-CoA synthetase (NDP forming)